MAYYKGGDPQRGALLTSTRAGQCHSFEQGGLNGTGPNLFGIVGRVSGTIPGFTYSKANADARVMWTPDVLDEYLTNPRKFLPGNRMNFAGLKKEKDRYDVIAYLQTLK